MFFKKIKKTTLLILLTLISIPTNILAYSDYIIAGGQNIGIEIKSKGVMVVGTYLVSNNNLGEVYFYKMGHHGSKTSSTRILLNVIKPKVVVATCNAFYNQYGNIGSNKNFSELWFIKF